MGGRGRARDHQVIRVVRERDRDGVLVLFRVRRYVEDGGCAVVAAARLCVVAARDG